MSQISERQKWWIAVGIAVALTVVAYGPVFFLGKIPFPAQIVNGFPPYADKFPGAWSKPFADIGDLVTQFYPYHNLVSRESRRDGIPLWNPHVHSGEPLAGITQSALFYPPNMLYLFMNVKRAWAMQLVIERLLAILFTLLLLRELGVTPTGALVSSLLFGFCGFLVVWQGQAMADCAVWLPLICYAVLRLRRAGSARSIAVAACAFAMPVLGGHPETAAHLTAVGIALAGALMFSRSAGNEITSKQFAGRFLAVGLLAMGLSSIQMLPSIEWIANIHRSLASQFPPLPFEAILAFVSRDIIRATNSAGMKIPEFGAYMGLLIFVTVPLAALDRPRRRVIFVAAAVLAALSIVYGIGPLLPLLHTVPFAGLKHQRLILVASLGLAVLAGFGTATLERLEENRVLRWKFAMLASIGLTLGLVMILLLRARTHELVEPLSVPRSIVLLLLLMAIVVFARIKGWLSAQQFSLLAIVVLSFDVVTFSYGYLPFVPASEIFPPTELFDRLKQEPDPFRISQLEIAYAANSEIVYELDAAGGYGIPLERMFRFMEGAGMAADYSAGPDSSSFLMGRDRRVDMLNVRYILVPSFVPVAAQLRERPDRFRLAFSSNNTDVFENLRALPRAFLVPARGIEVIQDETSQLVRVVDPAFDPELTVVLPDNPIADETEEQGTPLANASVNWERRTANALQMKVNVSRPSVLVISQIFYPGWKATVNGRPVAVLPANYALTAVPLRAGAHDVTLFYAPNSVRIGAALSAVSLAITVFLALKRKRSFASPSAAGKS